jgi:hypothetical protein
MKVKKQNVKVGRKSLDVPFFLCKFVGESVIKIENAQS